MIRAAGLDGNALLKQANAPETASRYEAFTIEAIAPGIRRAPTCRLQRRAVLGTGQVGVSGAGAGERLTPLHEGRGDE